jgi:hypothetical protein
VGIPAAHPFFVSIYLSFFLSFFEARAFVGCLFVSKRNKTNKLFFKEESLC